MVTVFQLSALQTEFPQSKEAESATFNQPPFVPRSQDIRSPEIRGENRMQYELIANPAAPDRHHRWSCVRGLQVQMGRCMRRYYSLPLFPITAIFYGAFVGAVQSRKMGAYAIRNVRVKVVTVVYP